MPIVESVKEIAGSVRNLYRLDQSQWQERMKNLDSEAILKELNRNRKLLNINGILGRIESIGEVFGLVMTGLHGSLPGMVGFGGLIFGSVLIHGRPGVILNSRVNFINSEVHSRRDQAIFYQDVDTLKILESVPTS